MPKVTYFRDTDAQLRALIFGDAAKRTSVYDMAKHLRVDPKTVYKWREKPTNIKLSLLSDIGRYLKWSDDEWNLATSIIRKGKRC